MHSFARHRHSSSSEAPAKETKGLILNGGWRYDLGEWFHDTFSFRGKFRELRQRTANLARLQPGEQVLDVGCGTGTLAIEVARYVGRAGRVVGVDPGTQQIARARAKAARRTIPVEFQVGVIEQLPFPNQTSDVVFSTLMMHHFELDLAAHAERMMLVGGQDSQGQLPSQSNRVLAGHLVKSGGDFPRRHLCLLSFPPALSKVL